MDTNSKENLSWMSENTTEQVCETGDVLLHRKRKKGHLELDWRKHHGTEGVACGERGGQDE